MESALDVILHLPMMAGRSLSINGERGRCELNERLVNELRARHPEAVEHLLDEYGRLLHGVAFHILRSRADADEVVIDTMVTAWQRIDSLRDPAALRAWLLRIGTRHALARRHRAAPPTLALPDVPFPLVSSPADAERIALADALDRLPPRMRACLSLHYYVGLSVAETADALGISPNTAKYHLKTGLERLRAALDVEPMRSSRSGAEP